MSAVRRTLLPAALLAPVVLVLRGAASIADPAAEALFRDYLAALNRHDVERAMSFYTPDSVFRRLGEPTGRTLRELRDIREWEAPMQVRFDAETLSVQGGLLSARLEETNLLYSALQVRRILVSEYRFRSGAIAELNLRSIREEGRPWSEARAELEGWLAQKPAGGTAGLLDGGKLVFDAPAGRRLLPHLDEWTRTLAAARNQHEAVLRSLVDAMNRHDVDAQYGHYAEDMVYLDGSRRIPPDRERERASRRFEAGARAVWSHAVRGAGLDSLHATLTEDMEYYRALGVGPRSSHRYLRFRQGRVIEMAATEWTQAGRPYEGARDGLAAWIARERPEAAAQVTNAGRLVFDGRSAPRLAQLAREWRRARPCTLYHPSYSPREPKLVFSSNCDGRWNIYVVDDDGARPQRLTDNQADSRRPAWSPDGHRVVFEGNRDGDWEVYSVGSDGSDPLRLTRQAGFDGFASFAPDGSHILFRSARAGSDELFLMSPDGSRQRPLTRGRNVDMRPAWSSDGTRILYGARASRAADEGQPIELFQIRPDGVEIGPLPGGPRREYNHAFSPGGALIAFDAHAAGAWESEDGRWELWLMNADGSGRRRLTDNAVNDWGPSWSPDGRRIVFLSGMNDVYDIYSMAADGSDRRRLTRWTDDFEGVPAR